jgi:hypothetical protein
VAANDPPVQPPEFGKLLCYDKGGIIAAVLLFGIMGGLMLAGGISEMSGAKVFMTIGLFFFGILFSAVAIFVLVSGPSTTWFFEGGVVQKNRKGVRQLAYSNVAQVAYGVWMQRSNTGVQTYMNLGFRPRDGSRDLKFNTVLSPGTKSKPGRLSENQVHELGHSLASMVAKEMLATLKQGQAVEWTKDIMLEPTGVRGGSEDFVTWDRIVSADINESNGYIEVQTKDSAKPVVRMSNSDMNARSGMYVIQHLTSHR